MRAKQARTGQQPLRAAGTGNAGLPARTRSVDDLHACPFI
jgi:hypothetical protein